MKSKVLWITQTAIFLALIIITQTVTKSMGQLVTGSIVNFILVSATLIAGIYSGITVALLSPMLAFLLGIGLPFIWLQPLIAVGNLVIVVIMWLFVNRSFNKKMFTRCLLQVSGVIVGATFKFLTLWLLIVEVAMPIVVNTLKPPQITAMSGAFGAQSFMQLITALIGSFAAILIVPTIKKAIKAR